MFSDRTDQFKELRETSGAKFDSLISNLQGNDELMKFISREGQVQGILHYIGRIREQADQAVRLKLHLRYIQAVQQEERAFTNYYHGGSLQDHNEATVEKAKSVLALKDHFGSMDKYKEWKAELK